VSERWPRPSQDRHHSEESPATHAEIDQAERRLGVRFPADYRSYLLGQNGLKGWFGDVYLELYPVSRVVDATEAHDHQTWQPGLVLIGGDGAGEAVGYDFRKPEPPIVLVNLVSAGWNDASFQAASFTEFMGQRRRGEEFSFVSGYE